MWYSKEYDPIQVGSIDGTDIYPHDSAIARAIRSDYRPPKDLKTDPNNTLFISRLNFDTTELTIRPLFEKYGKISNIELIRNNVTGLSQGYAFITFENSKSTRDAYRDANEAVLDDHVIFVDYERSRGMVGWIPRRLGGGFGGKKESGQLRFGARDRPFRDSHGKIKIQYEQKRSDVWRQDESSKRSNDHSSDKHQSSDKHHSCDKHYSSDKHHSSDKNNSSDNRHERSDNHHSERSNNRHGDRHDNSRSDKQYRNRRRSPSPEYRSSKKYTSDSRHYSDSKRKRSNSSPDDRRRRRY